MRTKTLSSIFVISLFGCVAGCATPSPTDLDGNVDLTEAELARGEANVAGFVDPPEMTDQEVASVLAKYENVDHQGVREELYQKAIVYYDTNRDRITNKKYVTIIDFQKHSGKRRFFILDMNGGPVESHVTAHGANSDPDDDGYATIFSNVEESHKSSIGFYIAAETYDWGPNGLSMRLDGLSPTNSNARPRGIVIHGADYVSDGRAKQGLSWGCPALPEREKKSVIDRLKNGSLVYAWN